MVDHLVSGPPLLDGLSHVLKFVFELLPHEILDDLHLSLTFAFQLVPDSLVTDDLVQHFESLFVSFQIV